MASEERNALAELAHELCGVIVDSRHYATVGECIDVMNALKKAQRIIAELAKVSTLGPKHIPGDISLYKAYAECRAIAAEEENQNEKGGVE